MGGLPVSTVTVSLTCHRKANLAQSNASRANQNCLIRSPMPLDELCLSAPFAGSILLMLPSCCYLLDVTFPATFPAIAPPYALFPMCQPPNCRLSSRDRKTNPNVSARSLVMRFSLLPLFPGFAFRFLFHSYPSKSAFHHFFQFVSLPFTTTNRTNFQPEKRLLLIFQKSYSL